MDLPAVYIGHPEVEYIQPQWHCLLRFRQRHFRDQPGSDEALAALLAALGEAEITTRPPAGVRSSQPFSLWAVNGHLGFPLLEQGEGRWAAPTCLTASSSR